MNIRKIILYLLPKQFLSITFGKLADCKISLVKNLLITWFVKTYHPDMSFTPEQNPYKYASFNDFFTRALNVDFVFMLDNQAVLSPVSGAVCQFGKIGNGNMIQAKNHAFSIKALLSPFLQDYFQKFSDGDFINLYLSPADYHRVHMPCNGHLIKSVYLPGKLFPVNCWAAENISHLFSKNERLIMLFEGEFGPFIMIMVGAMMVSGIVTKVTGAIKTNKAIQEFDYRAKPLEFAQGAEIGHFQFGSTVIVILPKDVISWSDGLKIGNKIKVGDKLGMLNNS